jgi:hypothetical protein
MCFLIKVLLVTRILTGHQQVELVKADGCRPSGSKRDIMSGGHESADWMGHVVGVSPNPASRNVFDSAILSIAEV